MAANTGTRPSVGRLAEYKTHREIRGRRVPVFASFNRPGWRVGAVKHGKMK